MLSDLEKNDILLLKTHGDDSSIFFLGTTGG